VRLDHLLSKEHTTLLASFFRVAGGSPCFGGVRVAEMGWSDGVHVRCVHQQVSGAWRCCLVEHWLVSLGGCAVSASTAPGPFWAGGVGTSVWWPPGLGTLLGPEETDRRHRHTFPLLGVGGVVSSVPRLKDPRDSRPRESHLLVGFARDRRGWSRSFRSRHSCCGLVPRRVCGEGKVAGVSQRVGGAEDSWGPARGDSADGCFFWTGLIVSHTGSAGWVGWFGFLTFGGGIGLPLLRFSWVTRGVLLGTGACRGVPGIGSDAWWEVSIGWLFVVCELHSGREHLCGQVF
jgi:hypothetical protein